jgi:hypothetical protein
MELLGFISVNFGIRDQLLNTYSAYLRNQRNNGSTMDFKKVCDSFWRKVLFNVHVECGINMSLKQIGLIGMFLNETYSKVHLKIFIWLIFSLEWSEKKSFTAIAFQLYSRMHN